MSVALEALRYKPQAYFKVDTAAPFADVSGYGRSGVMSAGTATASLPLVAGCAASYVFSSANVGKFTSNVFNQGQEQLGFSIGAWAFPISDETTAAEQQILGHTTKMDGLTVNGTVVSFVTKYLTTGECRASFDLQVLRRAYIVGVHTSSKNYLFVNGELAAETEITTAQQADQFVATDGFLYTGATTGTWKIAVNGIGIYASPLDAASISRIYAVGTRFVGKDSVAPIYSGLRIPMTVNEADVFMSQSFVTNDDWGLGLATNVTVMNNMLQPQLASTGISIAGGTWLSSFALDTANATSIYGVNLNWDGVGAVVEASLDGTTWETAVRGKNLALISPGYNPTGKDLQIRITFPGGVSNDPAYVDNLTVTGFLTGTNKLVANRTITYTAPAYVKNDHEPVEMSQDFGVELRGGTVTIGADGSDDPTNPLTVEVWMKQYTGTAPTFSSNLTTGSTQYSNGAAGSTMKQGEWCVRHFVLPSATTASITISGNVQVGHVVLYDTALSAAQISEIVQSYSGYPVTRATDATVLGITESSPGATLYAHDWAITASG